MVGVMVTSSKRTFAMPPRTAAVSAPDSAADHCPTGKSGLVFCGIIALFSWVLVYTRFSCPLQESVFPVL